MIERTAFVVEDARPVMLRAVDRPEDAQAVMIELADLMRQMAGELEMIRVIVTRDWLHDPARAQRRAQARVLEVDEALDRAERLRERLAIALRREGAL